MNKYDEMTTQELEDVLRNEETDTETVLYVLDVLAARQDTSEDDHAQESWEYFRQEYLSCKSPLLLGEKKNKRKSFRMLRYAAACVVLLLTAFSVLFMSVEAFRVAVVNIVIENNNGHWHITGEDKTEGEITPAENNLDVNDPLGGLIPEDYVLENISNANPKRINASYRNAEGEFVHFMMFPISGSLQLDSENADVSKEVRVLNCDGVLVIKQGEAQIAWWDEQSGTTYCVAMSNGTEDKILMLANQIAKNICA